MHKKMQDFVRTLNVFYKSNKAFFEEDTSWEGFKWISNDDNEQSVISFYRSNKKTKKTVVVCNFVPVEREEYRIGVEQAGDYEIVLNTDDEQFGGTGTVIKKVISSEKISMHGLPNSISLRLPPLSVMYLERRPKKRATNRPKK